MQELEENDNHISSESMFHLIYECYDELYKFTASKELIIKFSELKYSKRIVGIWIHFLSGVIQKIK